ncbi:MAG: methyltransferase [Dehalococcoidia bacterium]|nr:methyltransferase [Dehalococcoidia bacterium]
MRVIAGTARGIELRSPRGGRTRPTTGRLRESLFSMLEAAGADFSEVLDLYAGSGALGIEALSRGGGRCTFVEADARAAAVVRENLERTRLADRGTVVTARVGRWRPAPGYTCTLVLADPPYDDPGPWEAIAASVQGALAEASVIIVEHAARTEPPPVLTGRALWRDRRQGDGAVAIYRLLGEGSE